MKILKTVVFVLALFLIGTFVVPSSRADEHDKKSVVTITTPFEIPGGQILPAGTYVFQLADSAGDRNIVQIWNADSTKLIANVLAISDFRMTPNDKNVMMFSERPGDQPNAIKVWFYPGEKYGQEFVYSKERAMELAAAAKEPVPAMTAESLPIVADLKTTPLYTVTPDQQEKPYTQDLGTKRELPKTASLIPLIALLGVSSLGLALVLKQIAG